MTEDLPVTIRAATAADLPLIYSSWLKSYHDSDGVRHVPNDAYFSEHKAVLERLLQRSRVLCAVFREDPSTVFGWCCAEPSVLHYVYTKNVYRGHGVAKLLLDAAGLLTGAPVTCTHLTRALHAWRGRGRAYTYNPYLLWR